MSRPQRQKFVFVFIFVVDFVFEFVFVFVFVFVFDFVFVFRIACVHSNLVSRPQRQTFAVKVAVVGKAT